MPELRDEAPLQWEDAAAIAAVRDALERADYRERPVVKALGLESAAEMSFRPGQRSTYAHRVGGDRSLDVFIRLFMLGMDVSMDDFQRVVAPSDPAAWVDLGLVATDAGRVLANLALLPFQDLVLASDAAWLRNARLRNFVMGTTGSTVELTRLTIRRPVGRVLDVGCGGGIHAILAAAHAGAVVGVDINARALNLARFNARLNGRDNVEFCQGDLLAPVQGERFDQIVTNPPFVISPMSEYLFRDSGHRRDDITAELTSALPEYLEEGGFAQIICEWVDLAGQSGRERMAGWIAGRGCDAWVLQFGRTAPETYASAWVETEVGNDVERAQHEFARWMTYFEAEKIEAIRYGVVTLRRRAGALNWLRIDEAPPTLNGPCGASVWNGFQLRDFLETVRDDAAFLAARLHMNPALQWEQILRPTAESWQVLAGRVRFSQGLCYSGTIDMAAYELLNGCRGAKPLSAVLERIAAVTGSPVASFQEGCLHVTRGLIEQGFLVPEGLELDS